MGEDPGRVRVVGSPALDDALSTPPASDRELDSLGLDPGRPFLVIAQHPLSLEPGRGVRDLDETIGAVIASGAQALCVFPNLDAGGRRMIWSLERRPRKRVVVRANLDRRTFLGALRRCAAIVGNSSAGIIECSALKVPAINVGSRQAGRERGANVIDVPARRVEIRRALKKVLTDRKWRRAMRQARSPYGDGRSSARIVEAIKSVKDLESLFWKSAWPRPDGSRPGASGLSKRRSLGVR
jgi:UDP-hydrolysing UDP-N-acetyl-D-glucosamine 2-epimerase